MDQVGDPEKILVIGAGKFGSKAARALSSKGGFRVWVVDQDPDRLGPMQDSCDQAVVGDGVQFLADHGGLFSQKVIIVPALPIHLAYKWFLKTYSGPGIIRGVNIPDRLLPHVAFRMRGEDGTVYLSHADFLCPEDCPEPPECTVTGERRIPLYKILEGVKAEGYGVSVIRSRQLAPGVGGYPIGELASFKRKVTEGSQKKWLIATSCRCHGAISAFEILD